MSQQGNEQDQVLKGPQDSKSPLFNKVKKMIFPNSNKNGQIIKESLGEESDGEEDRKIMEEKRRNIGTKGNEV